MKIKLDYQKIKEHLDDETFELFREFIDRVVVGELFAGCDPQPYDLIDIKADIEIEVDDTDDSYINDLERDNAFMDDDSYEDERDSPFFDGSDDYIDDVYRD